MKRTVISDGFRWALVPFAALLGFVVSVVLSQPLNMIIHQIFWSSGNAMPGKMFILYSWAFDGALAASLVIQFGCYAAPNHKRIAALFLLVLGGIIAWQLVGEFYLPLHSFHNAATRTWWPITGTYLGGTVTCAWIWFAQRGTKQPRFKA